MRSVRSVVWSFVFLSGASIPAFCQVIVPPNIPGAAVPADLGTAAFQQSVYSTGPFDFLLVVFMNGRPKYCTSATVCTSGPFASVTCDVPLGCFGLVAGDTLIYAFSVRHRGTEGNTASMTISVIPVVAAASPPTQTTKASLSPPDPTACWARREEPGIA